MGNWSRAKEWEADGIRYHIMKNSIPGYGEYYCGYCTFTTRPVAEVGYDGAIADVDVHGGVTCAEENKDGSYTYGFDCAHADDDDNPLLHDLNWLTAECESMARQILLIAESELRQEQENE